MYDNGLWQQFKFSESRLTNCSPKFTEMKNYQKLTLLFWHRKSKADAKGYAPVICRISIEGEESEELSIDRKARIADWDIENKKAKGGIEAKKTNLKIAEVTVDLERHFARMQSEYERITPLMLKNVYQGKPGDSAQTDHLIPI